VRDLTYEADILQARTFRPFETYLVVTAIYFILATGMRRSIRAGAVRWLFGGSR
jgi:polar amino acid transport system permease protein